MSTLASLLVELGLKFGGKAEADKAKDGLEDIADQAEDTQKSIEDMADGSKVALGAVGVAAGAALTAGFISSLNIDQGNDLMAAQLGLTEQQAADAGEAAGDLFAGAWGESMGDVNDAIKGVEQNIDGMRQASESDLEDVSEQALILAQVMDEDVGDVTRSVGQLMRTGLADSATEAFDVITRGAQLGANRNQDLLDTLNEYPTQFRDLGLNASESMGLLVQATQAGARDTDVAADALKELNIRVKDLSAAPALQQLGLDAHDMAEAFAEGGPTARDALSDILDGLKDVKDPAKRAALSVQLMGTQSEDMAKAIMAFDPDSATAALGDLQGATQRAGQTMSDNASTNIESFKRAVTTTFVGVVGGTVIPLVQRAASTLSTVFGPAVNAVTGFLSRHQAILLPLLAVLGTAVGVILAVKAAVQLWTIAQAALNVVMAANPIVLIIAAVAGLVVGILVLWNKSEAFRDFWIGAWDAISGAAVAVWNWIKSNWPHLLAILTGPIGIAVDLIAHNWDTIKGGATAAKDWIVDRFNDVLDFFQAFPGKIGDFFSGLADAIKGPFEAAFNGIASLWNNSVGKLSFHIPSWVPGVGGKGFDVPDIPTFAEGGPFGPGMALVGERGPELVRFGGSGRVFDATQTRDIMAAQHDGVVRLHQADRALLMRMADRPVEVTGDLRARGGDLVAVFDSARPRADRRR